MKATVDGITYEGTEDEIRRIVENPPVRVHPIRVTYDNTFPCDENQPVYNAPVVTLKIIKEPHNG